MFSGLLVLTSEFCELTRGLSIFLVTSFFSFQIPEVETGNKENFSQQELFSGARKQKMVHERRKIMNQRIGFGITFVILASFVLAACSTPAATPTRDHMIDALATGQAQLMTQIAQPSPTAFQPVAATPTLVVVVPPTIQPAVVSEWTPYEDEGGVPYNGTTLSLDVAPDELEVVTAGPACIAGVCLPGGVDRGTIIIMLPASDVVVHYTVTGLIAGSNWHGSYRPLGDPVSETNWRALAEDRIKAMQIAPNCTSGKGCKVVDVVVVGPSGIVARWIVGP